MRGCPLFSGPNILRPPHDSASRLRLMEDSPWYKGNDQNSTSHQLDAHSRTKACRRSHDRAHGAAR